jgi:plastocyanin
MGARQGGEIGRRLRRRLLPLVLVGFGCLQASVAVATGEATIEVEESASGFAWNPASVTLGSGGSVAIRNPSMIVPHGLAWTAGPEKPSCSGIPVGSSGTDWSGTCTFAQPGTYTFVCTVHPEEMRGTVTVSGAEGAPVPTPAPMPAQPQGPGTPPGSALESLRLSRAQDGAAVRGSIAVSAAAAGGKLEVALRARRSALGGQGGGMAPVGRLVRSHLTAGPQTFTASLTTSAKQALARRGHLFVQVRIVVTPLNRQATAVRRGVELHD